RVLDPRPHFTPQNIRDFTDSYCEQEMTLHLTEAVDQKIGWFKNAKILVTGYFPIFSSQSDLVQIQGMGGFQPSFGIVPPGVLWKSAIAKSDMFYKESSIGLQASVDQANRRDPRNRARFVDVVFGPDEAYGAPNSLLWLIPGFLQNPLDDVYNERKKICDSISDLPVSKTECEHASMGHPNPKGARRYADSIIRVLQQFVPEWKARRGSIASSAPGSPLYIEIAYAPRTATGAGIMTVHAAD